MAIKFKTPKTAINTTTRDMQNLSSDCPPCPEVNLTTADVEYTANGEYTVTPEAGYDGLTQVDITVSVPSDINNQNKTVTPTTSSQSVTADSGYSGLGTVTVDAVTSSIDANIAAGNIKKNVSILGVTGSYDPQPTLQAKTATPTTSQQVITPDTGNDGLSQVTISAVTASIDENIQPENILSGVEILGVTGTDAGYTQGYTEGYDAGQADCPAPVLETVTATYTTNDTYTITPTQGYDGIDEVTVTVNVSGSNCPDWSSIDWTCSDVTASGVADDVAYTASVKNNNDWQNDTNLVFAPTTSNSDAGRQFMNNTSLRYCPVLELTGTTAKLEYLFYGDTSLTYVGNISRPNSNISTTANNMFANCNKLKTVGIIDMNNINNASFMFNACTVLTTIGGLTNFSPSILDSTFYGCRSLTSIPSINTSNVTSMSSTFANAFITQSMADAVGQWDTSNVTSFYNCFSSNSSSSVQWASRAFTTAPAFDMSSATNVSEMFAVAHKSNATLTTIPQYNWANVSNVYNLFGNYGSRRLTTVGGFINLGKGFKSVNPSTHHLLNFTGGESPSLDHTALMNIINNLAAPDDTDVTDATLKISSASYALLDASDIAIATAKNWSVVSL